MNILLTNDDGINSPALGVLTRLLSSFSNVWVCAPETQQSGASHGIVVHDTVTVRRAMVDGAIEAWSVDGYPSDCVRVAFMRLLKEPIDIVVSGINHGANLGTDIFYSGTVGAAMEGAMRDLPAIALSLSLTPTAEDRPREQEPDYEAAAKVAVRLLKKWARGALPIRPRTVLNVNIPELPYEEIKGYRLTRMGVQRYSDVYETVEEDGDHKVFRLRGDRLPSHDPDPAIDLVAVASGYVALTPLVFDRTDYKALRELEKLGVFHPAPLFLPCFSH